MSSDMRLVHWNRWEEIDFGFALKSSFDISEIDGILKHARKEIETRSKSIMEPEQKKPNSMCQTVTVHEWHSKFHFISK